MLYMNKDNFSSKRKKVSKSNETLKICYISRTLTKIINCFYDVDRGNEIYITKNDIMLMKMKFFLIKYLI